MPVSSHITAQNVFASDILTFAVTLLSGSPRWVLPTDPLDLKDRDRLDQLYVANGSTFPLSDISIAQNLILSNGKSWYDTYVGMTRYVPSSLLASSGSGGGGGGGAVSSVAGQTGAVVLTAADVGLPLVNNTSDADKPVSTATSAAITSATSGKQNTLVSGSSIKTINGTSVLGAGNIPVTEINGVTYGGAPTTGQVLTASSSTSAQWSAPLVITGANVIAGSGSPGAGVGSTGDYYTQLDAAAGASNVWGPKTAGGWPGAASFDDRPQVQATSSITGSVRLTGDLGGTATAPTVPGLATKQPLDADLTAIAALTGTAGFLKTTGTGTWSVDSASYLTGNQTITFTGDATGSGASTVSLVIPNGRVTLAKQGNLPANTIQGNNTGAAGIPLALTVPQATAMLNTFTSTDKGLVPSSGGGTTTFLRADGTFATPSGGGGGTSLSKSYPFSQTVVKGDILEVWDDAGTVKARKASQATITTGFNTHSSGSFTSYRINGWWNRGNANSQFIMVYAGDTNSGTQVQHRALTWDGTSWVSSTPVGGYAQGNFDTSFGVLACGGLNSTLPSRALLGAPGSSTTGFTFWSCPADGSSASSNLVLFNGNDMNSGVIFPAFSSTQTTYMILNSGTSSNIRYGSIIYSSASSPTVGTVGPLTTSLDVDGNYAFTYAHAPAGTFPLSARQWNFLLLKRNASSSHRFVGLCIDATGNFTTYLESSNFTAGSTSPTTVTTLGVNGNIAYIGFIDGANLRVRTATITSDSTVTYGATDVANIAHGLSGNAVKVIAHKGLTSGQILLMGENGTGNQLASRTGTINLTTGAVTLTATQPYTIGAGQGSGNSVQFLPLVRSDTTNGSGMVVYTNSTNSTTLGFVEASLGTVNLTPTGIAKAAVTSGSTGDVSLSGDVITGMTGLSVGQKYYMNTSSGALQTAQTSVSVGMALSSTEFQVRLT